MTGSAEFDEIARKYNTDKASTYTGHDQGCAGVLTEGSAEHPGNNYSRYYTRHLSHLRHEPIRLVELGIWQGASLRTWAEWFDHPDRQIIGVDINQEFQGDKPECVEIFWADQASPPLATAIADRGNIDIIIDDASHDSWRTIDSFKVWWPQLKPDGLYVIEDLWFSYHLGASPSGCESIMQYLLSLADELHCGDSVVRARLHNTKSHLDDSGYHAPDLATVRDDIAEMHFYPQICFIKKLPTKETAP